MSPFTIPGVDIPTGSFPISSKPGKSLKLGPGLQQTLTSNVVPVLAGTLLTDNKKIAAWVEAPAGRYVPSQNDQIIASVVRGGMDSFLCTITPHGPTVQLPHLAFEGVSKKTRPQFQRGTLVYARVASVNKSFETELTCVDPSTGKGEGLGELKDGVVFDVSLGLARRLLVSKQRERGSISVLEDLAEKIAFEIAVGRNGKVWVDSENVKDTLLVVRALRETDKQTLSLDEQRKLVRALLKNR